MTRRTQVPQETIELICKKHLSGSNINQLNKEFGLGRRIIERVLKQNGILRLNRNINRDKYPELKDYETLNKMYNVDLMTIDDIARSIGVSSQLVKNAFKELGIPPRSRSEATIITGIKKNPDLSNIKLILNLYGEGNSINSIAEQMSSSETTIRRILLSNDIEIRSHSEQMSLCMKPENEINAKISRNLRSRLSIALKNNSKRGSAVKDLGCTIDEFKKYLESHFYDSDDGIPMRWDNYGKNGWELDHITPLSSFDLSDPDQFKKACNYKNITPAWRCHNRAKSSMPIGRRPKKIPLIILTGQSGSGKSWVVNRLRDAFQTLEYDRVPKEQHYHYLVEMSHSNSKPIIYDPLRKPMSIYRRYSNLFDTKLIVIVEEPDVVKQRIIGRGGSSISNVDLFYSKFKKLAAKAHFHGTSSEVLSYIKSLHM